MEKENNKPFKGLRKKHNIEIEKMTSFLNSAKSTVYYLENNFMNNKMFRYLLSLRRKGVNINKILDNIEKE